MPHQSHFYVVRSPKQYLVESTNHEDAPHAISSSPQVPFSAQIT
jgi:hypothetical protein